jgi:hypothetical protein
LPWRLNGSEAALVGCAAGEAAFVAAGERAIEGARPLEKNAFKIPLLRNAVIRALQTIGGPLRKPFQAHATKPSKKSPGRRASKARWRPQDCSTQS